MWSEKFGFREYSSDWKLSFYNMDGTLICLGNDRKMISHRNIKLNFLKNFWDVVRSFWSNLVWFKRFYYQGQSSNLKLTIFTEETSNWPGNDDKMTLKGNFKLIFSKRFFNLSRSVSVWTWCDLRAWLSLLTIKVINGLCKTRNECLVTKQWKWHQSVACN